MTLPAHENSYHGSITNMANPLKIVNINDDDALDLIFDAAKSQGFLFIEGHDFSQNEVDELFTISKEFFELSSQEKNSIPRNSDNHGYVNFGGEKLDPLGEGDPKEALNISDLNCITGKSVGPMHAYFDSKKLEVVESAIKKLYQLNLRLLNLLAVGLQIKDLQNVPGPDWFTEKYDPVKPLGTTLRFLHYGKNSASEIRAGAHTDYGSITLLFQQSPGLEITSKSEWLKVPSLSSNVPGEAPPIVVNIGDQLSYWSSGLLKLTIHRVRFLDDRDRYSIAFFSHPNDDALLSPFPSALTEGLVGGEIITAGEHLMRKLGLTYEPTDESVVDTK